MTAAAEEEDMMSEKDIDELGRGREHLGKCKRLSKSGVVVELGHMLLKS